MWIPPWRLGLHHRTMAHRGHPRLCTSLCYILMCSPVHFGNQVKRNSLTSPFPQSSPPSTPTPKGSNNIVLAVLCPCPAPQLHGAKT